MFCFNVLATGLEAMVHGGLQTNLMAMAACFYAVLHGL
jgi:cbb3-type cytochrome oxidase subunit 3